MPEDKRKDPPDRPEKSSSPRDTKGSRAEARARLRNATGGIGPDMSGAAERAVAELRMNFARRGAQIGFLDDVVDFTEDVADVTNEIINHIAANTEELAHMTEELTPGTPLLVTLIGLASETPDGSGQFPDEGGVSAQQLLETRKAILERTEIQRRSLEAMAQSLRAQIAAMSPPKK